MSSADTDDTPELPAEIRAAGLELSDGALLVYDVQNHRAWVWSDGPLDLGRHR